MSALVVSVRVLVMGWAGLGWAVSPQIDTLKTYPLVPQSGTHLDRAPLFCMYFFLSRDS